MKVTTTSADETRALGAAFARVLRAGDVVVLEGDLGAGKTTFVQGVGAALGVDEPMVSPTFTIVREYDVDVPIAHVDVYRLDTLGELHDLGFEDVLDGTRITFVEWGDVIAQALPHDRVVVRLELGAADDERIITVVPHGTKWAERIAAVEREWTDHEAG
jgi:tRNA threonylcarbamoyladenosine biosynthesis protein TsaE